MDELQLKLLELTSECLPYDHTLPLWSLNGKRQFVEFDLFSARDEDYDINTGLLEEINNKTYKCYICDVHVPLLFYQKHNNSAKHKTCKRIIEICLDRSKEHIENNVSGNNSELPANVYFCESCSIIIPDANKHHKFSKEHINNVARDDKLQELVEIFTKTHYDFKESNTNLSVNINDDLKAPEPENCNLAAEIDEIKHSENDKEKSEKKTKKKPKKSAEIAPASNSNQWALLNTSTTDSDDSNEETNSELIENNTKTTEDDLKVPDVEETEIKLPNGQVMKVPTENYNGFYLNDETLQCRVCHEVVEDKEEHKTSEKHKTRVQIPVQDYNCIREIDDKWSHCILCNSNISSVNSALHISSDTHFANVKSSQHDIYDRKTNKNPESKEKTKHPKKKKSLKSTKQIAELEKLLFASKKYPDDYFCVSESGKVTCKVCSVDFSYDYGDQLFHLISPKHVTNYNTMLSNNKIHQNQSGTYMCGYCELELLNGFVHIESKLHKDKVASYVPVAKSASKEDKSEKNTDFKHHFEIAENVHQLDCLICKVKLPNTQRNATEHALSIKHKNEYDLLMTKHQLNDTGEIFSCVICKTSVPKKHEIKHIKSKVHKSNYFRIASKETSKKSKKVDVATQLLSVKDITNTESPVIEQSPFDFCDTCDVNIPNDSASINAHSLSQQHKANLQKSDKENYNIEDNILATQNTAIKPASLNLNKLKNKLSECNIPKDDNINKTDPNKDDTDFPETTKVVLQEDQVVYVPSTNYHGFLQIGKTVVCHLCSSLVKDKKEHMASIAHKSKVQVPVQDINCIRKIDAHWCHCILCNETICSVISHIKSDKHLALVKNIENEEKSSKNRVRKHCEICNVSMRSRYYDKHINNHNSDQQKLAIESRVSTIDNYVMADDGLTCKACRVVVPNGDKRLLHMISPEHIANYKSALTKNKINQIEGSKYRCGLCDLELLKGYEFFHIDNKIHQDKLAVDRLKLDTASQTKETDKKLENSDVMYQFNIADNPKELDCIVCNVKLPNTESNVTSHTFSNKHKNKYNLLMSENEVNNDGAELHCLICKTNIADKKELEHINSTLHKTMKKLNYVTEKNEETHMLKCKVCKCPLPCVIDVLVEHVNGKNHAKNFSRILSTNLMIIKDGATFCEACNVSVKEFNEISHIETLDHSNNLKVKEKAIDVKLLNKNATESKVSVKELKPIPHTSTLYHTDNLKEKEKVSDIELLNKIANESKAILDPSNKLKVKEKENDIELLNQNAAESKVSVNNVNDIKHSSTLDQSNNLKVQEKACDVELLNKSTNESKLSVKELNTISHTISLDQKSHLEVKEDVRVTSSNDLLYNKDGVIEDDLSNIFTKCETKIVAKTEACLIQ